MDEPKIVEATHGPYAGQRLTMPAKDADAAVKDGWAFDPFGGGERPDHSGLSDEERGKLNTAAEKAARKLRGDPDEDKDKDKSERQAQGQKPATTRDMQADEGEAYETRRASTAQQHPQSSRPSTTRR